VYGGGGIMPDIFVPIDTATYPAGVNRLFLDGTFNNFVYTWYLGHRQKIDGFPSVEAYTTEFNSGEAMWEPFINYASRDSVNLHVLNTAQKAALQKRLEAFLGRFRWRSNGYFQILNSEDGVIKKAIETLEK